MINATVCEKWKLEFPSFENENNVSLHDRSYIHYAKSHARLVAAKAAATEWLFTDIIQEKDLSVIEYMAGIGIQTLVVRELIKPKLHILNEINLDCVKHLEHNFSECFITNHDIFTYNARENIKYDVHLLDLPHSSILQINKKWKNIFFSIFVDKPKLVVWTDTSVTYPMSIHGKKYAEIFKTGEIKTKYDYVENYSKWLYDAFGYSIKRAAFRANNAVYFAAFPGLIESIEYKEFSVKDNLKSFVFEDQNISMYYD